MLFRDNKKTQPRIALGGWSCASIELAAAVALSLCSSLTTIQSNNLDISRLICVQVFFYNNYISRKNGTGEYFHSHFEVGDARALRTSTHTIPGQPAPTLS